MDPDLSTCPRTRSSPYEDVRAHNDFERAWRGVKRQRLHVRPLLVRVEERSETAPPRRTAASASMRRRDMREHPASTVMIRDTQGGRTAHNADMGKTMHMESSSITSNFQEKDDEVPAGGERHRCGKVAAPISSNPPPQD